ncbi:hypothetical protein GQX74_008047 [Glossina fuscipes]|nr:hypothetical protein GQX74_008047 [Glossina fuscipes]
MRKTANIKDYKCLKYLQLKINDRRYFNKQQSNEHAKRQQQPQQLQLKGEQQLLRQINSKRQLIPILK